MDITNCKLCDNCIKRKNVVEGIGNKSAQVMFLFDSPTYRQDKTGKLLDDPVMAAFIDIVGKFGYDLNNSYFTFLLKCRALTTSNFVNGLDICTNANLKNEYSFLGIKKKVVVVVGKPACDFMLGKSSYRYFQPYESDTLLIPIPSIYFFAKANSRSINKLNVISYMLNR